MTRALVLAMVTLVMVGCMRSLPVDSVRAALIRDAPVEPAHHDQARIDVHEAYARLPLSFEANRGQTDPRVDFVARGVGYGLFVTPTGVVLTLRQTSSPPTATALDAEAMGAESPGGAVLRVTLAGAQPAARSAPGGEQRGRVNYFQGSDPGGWRTDVPSYRHVVYRDVYAGIDVTYYGAQRELEYDFAIAPGADPGTIRMVMEGAHRIRVNREGDLVLSVGGGEVYQRRPLAYQEVAGVRKVVPVRYVLHDRNQVSLETGEYDRSRPLIIDPVLVYSTYLGGLKVDGGYGIAVDGDGSAYVTGRTQSLNFPVTPGAFQTVLGGSDDVFVAKLTPDGSALVYATFIGGMGSDWGQSIAVDAAKNAYITGRTRSLDFPTVNPLQPGLGGGNDAFVAKLNPQGNALVYSTYLGGTGGDIGHGIAVDIAGRAYVTGETSSVSTFPRVLALQNTYGGGGDAFVARLNAAGSALDFSTYLGGSSLDSGFGIAVDGSGVYVAGRTRSANFPTQNPFDATRGGSEDAFVAKLQPDGSALIYSTYLGGSAIDFAQGIAVDVSGNALVTGETRSLDFPTSNAIQPNPGGGPDAFVTKLNATGSALVFSTYLGGVDDDSGSGIAVDIAGNAYVAGLTRSNNFPTLNPLQGFNGSFDGFVAKLNPSGGLVYSTYLGGGNDDYALAIAADVCGNAFVTGQTSARDFPLVNPLQAVFAGSQDAFVAKIGDRVQACATDVAIVKVGPSTPVAPGATFFYIITVTNVSQVPATNVVVTDPLPAGTSFVSCTTSQGICSEAGGVVTALLGSLAPGASATITLQVSAPAACTAITNTATVTATADSNPGNNSSTVVTPCQAPPPHPDVKITKAGAPNPVAAGGELTYTLSVQNVGGVTATNVVVTDPLPAGTNFISCTPSQGTCSESSGVVTASLGSLGAGATATIVLKVSAPTGPACTDIVNTVTVTAPGDSNPANNTATITTACTQEGGQGCTPGFWKAARHFDSWTAPYTPKTLFSAVFENAFPGKTLLFVVSQGGGGLNALGRHTVAALLSASSPEVSYDLTPGEVIAMFNAVFPGTDADYEALKDLFEGFNEQRCPLN